MKKFVIVLARTFPKGHSRYGDTTNFRRSFIKGIGCKSCSYHISCFRTDSYCKNVCEFGRCKYSKIHTIRGNYELWGKRFKEIEEGKACLSIREWSGTPYRSKQREIACLTKDDGIGLQKLRFAYESPGIPCLEYPNGAESELSSEKIANNDGLSVSDWIEWFDSINDTENLAIIHFTEFRYE